MKRIFKKTGKVILFLFTGIVAIILVLLMIIKINSSGKPEPIVDKNGNNLPNSIAIIKDTVINGAT